VVIVVVVTVSVVVVVGTTCTVPFPPVVLPPPFHRLIPLLRNLETAPVRPVHDRHQRADLQHAGEAVPIAPPVIVVVVRHRRPTATAAATATDGEERTGGIHHVVMGIGVRWGGGRGGAGCTRDEYDALQAAGAGAGAGAGGGDCYTLGPPSSLLADREGDD